MTLTLNDHLDKFDKVINCKWNEVNDLKNKIDIKVKILQYYYRKPHERDDFVLLELFNMYLLGGYDKKYDPSKSNLLTYITIFINSHLDTMLNKRRKRELWEQGEREEIKKNRYRKKIRYKSCDVYDKNFRESLPDDDRNIQVSNLEDPEYKLFKRQKKKMFLQYAKKINRVNEAKIVIGVTDYKTVIRQTGISNDTIRKRVCRLVVDFNQYYEDLL